MHLPFGGALSDYLSVGFLEASWSGRQKEPRPLTGPSTVLGVYLRSSRFGEGIRPGCLIEVAAFW